MKLLYALGIKIATLLLCELCSLLHKNSKYVCVCVGKFFCALHKLCGCVHVGTSNKIYSIHLNKTVELWLAV